MEYFVILHKGAPSGIYETLLEALVAAKQKGTEVLLHRIHVKEGKWIVQEIGFKN
jgi:hypothetical protein